MAGRGKAATAPSKQKSKANDCKAQQKGSPSDPDLSPDQVFQPPKLPTGIKRKQQTLDDLAKTSLHHIPASSNATFPTSLTGSKKLKASAQPAGQATAVSGPLTLDSIKVFVETGVQSLKQQLDKQVADGKAAIVSLDTALQKRAKKDYAATCQNIEKITSAFTMAQDQHKVAMDEVKSTCAQLRKHMTNEKALDDAVKALSAHFAGNLQQLKTKYKLKC